MYASGSRQNSWGPLECGTLFKFLNEEVRISREETKKAIDTVLPRVEQVLQKVKEQDPRFSSEFLRSGSYTERLQVSEPDEFDFLVPLEGFPKSTVNHGCSSSPEDPPDASYMSVTLTQCSPLPCEPKVASISSWQQKDVSDPLPANRCLVKPDKVMSTFKKEVNEALETLKQKASVEVHRRYQGTPAVTFTVLHYKDEIDVDLVPLIRDPFTSWHFAWPRPGQSWPSADKIKEIKKTGVDLVAKHPLFWRFSFSRIERVLLEGIDADGGCRRDSLRILKKVRIDRWKPQFGKLLVSYHLKTTLFWACEKYPKSSDWSDLTMSFKRLVDDLIMYLSRKHLPHYFLGQQVNLFKPDSQSQARLLELCEEVKKFKYNPEYYLQVKA